MRASRLSIAAAFMLCAGVPAIAAHHEGAGHATAELKDAQGAVKGKAMFMDGKDGLSVTLNAEGLPPGVHAVHLHTTGACTAPDFKSAGGHWNPMSKQHGKDNPAGAHMGDMPNMTVGADGKGKFQTVVPHGMLTGGDHPLLDADGAAIVIHATADDYKTDPTGNAGDRLACGVVTK